MGRRRRKGFDERHERIEILLDVMGDFNNLSNELTGQPPCYSEIIDCVDGMIKTLNDSRAQLLKIKEEVDLGKGSYSDAGIDPA
jgi:hypothetical protein